MPKTIFLGRDYHRSTHSTGRAISQDYERRRGCGGVGFELVCDIATLYLFVQSAMPSYSSVLAAEFVWDEHSEHLVLQVCLTSRDGYELLITDELKKEPALAARKNSIK